MTPVDPAATSDSAAPSDPSDGAPTADDADASRGQRGQRFHPWMRLVRSKDFARVYRRGSRARGSFITVALARNDLDGTRLGLSIGKRMDKRAVARNRLRRLVREAFRLEYADLPRGFDLVAIGSTPKARPDLAALRRELRRLAQKAARRVAEREDSA